MRIPLCSRVQNPFRSTSIDKLLTVAGVTPSTRAKPSGAIPHRTRTRDLLVLWGRLHAVRTLLGLAAAAIYLLSLAKSPA
jgi:hypothetical protein